MLASARRWLRNNRAPIAIGAGVVGAGYIVAQYVLSKINDARDRMSSDRIAKENLRRRFEQNQEDCTFTVLALLPTATANILSVLDTENITYEIQQIKGAAKGTKATATATTGTGTPSIADTTLTDENGKSMASMHSESGVHASQMTAVDAETARKTMRTKRQLWDDLTISAITRAFTLVYTLALLTMLIRVQLNLLGRRSYLSSVVSLAIGGQQATISLENNDDDGSHQDYGNDFDTNRKYLTFSWWLLNKGWLDLMHRVEAAVRTVFGSLSPRDLVSFQRFGELTLEVRKRLEGATAQERKASAWLGFLLPPRYQEVDLIRQSGILDDNSAQGGSEQPSSAGLRRLLDETADLIESPAFSRLMTLLLDAGFSFLVDTKLAVEAFELDAMATTTAAAAAAVDARRCKVVLLPKILSVLTRQAHAIGNGVPNPYLREMESVRALGAFAAVIYSSNWENEMCDESFFDTPPADAGSTTHRHHPSPASPPSPPKSSEWGRGNGEQSLVIVEPSGHLDEAWERAMGKR